jgi:hypothetical protein
MQCRGSSTNGNFAMVRVACKGFATWTRQSNIKIAKHHQQPLKYTFSTKLHTCAVKFLSNNHVEYHPLLVLACQLAFDRLPPLLNMPDMLQPFEVPGVVAPVAAPGLTPFLLAKPGGGPRGALFIELPHNSEAIGVCGGALSDQLLVLDPSLEIVLEKINLCESAK